MKKRIKKMVLKFIKFLDTSPEIFSEKCYDILTDKKKTENLIVAIENDQKDTKDKLPSNYVVNRVG